MNNSIQDNAAIAGKMQGKAKKDLRKLKFYTCGKYGHYVSKFTRKKEGDNYGCYIFRWVR